MKSVLVATSLMAAMAMSKPLGKRYYVTETAVYTITVTETGGWAAGPTGGWGNWGGKQPADPATVTETGGWTAGPTDAWWNHGGEQTTNPTPTPPPPPAAPPPPPPPART